MSNRLLISLLVLFFSIHGATAQAQGNSTLKFGQSKLYAGIEVGAKGVKMSVLEIGKDPQHSGALSVIKDTSINTDFITFSKPTFESTLDGLYSLFSRAKGSFQIPSERIFTLVSSGVKIQAEKNDKLSWINQLVDSFKLRINEPERKVSVIDVLEEARLSHLGIVPEAKRYSTFLIDIGSGNTKGGYFPNGNTKDLKLFQLSWGTKSVANLTEKRCDEDKSISNYSKQLFRVLSGEPNSEIIYAVNVSGAYNMSDNIAVTGGIAWSIATLISPELVDNPIVPVTYADVVKFSEKLATDFGSFSPEAIVKSVTDKSLDLDAIAKEVKTVNKVFDQRALMAGTGLLLKIMRQFEGIYEKKQFFLVKTGQVGWISAYVDQTISK